MFSLNLRFLPALLCALLSLGQAPAWLHLMTCEASCSCQGTLCIPETQQSAGCPCGHEQFVIDCGENVDDGEQLPTEDEHDSDNCAVCQTLTGPGGARCDYEFAVTVHLNRDCESVLSDSNRPLYRWQAVQPRGPPTVS